MLHAFSNRRTALLLSSAVVSLAMLFVMLAPAGSAWAAYYRGQGQFEYNGSNQKISGLATTPYADKDAKLCGYDFGPMRLCGGGPATQYSFSQYTTGSPYYYNVRKIANPTTSSKTGTLTRLHFDGLKVKSDCATADTNGTPMVVLCKPPTSSPLYVRAALGYSSKCKATSTTIKVQSASSKGDVWSKASGSWKVNYANSPTTKSGGWSYSHSGWENKTSLAPFTVQKKFSGTQAYFQNIPIPAKEYNKKFNLVTLKYTVPPGCTLYLDVLQTYW